MSMREDSGNIWNMKGDAIVITTNGTIKNNGECVMGRGIASEAKENFRWVPIVLGQAISDYGNQVYSLGIIPSFIDNRGWKYIMSFPVKHNWWEEADKELIHKSCKELVRIITHMNLRNVLVPRPGCGNGGLDWEEDVKPIVSLYFDNRFIVVTR